MSLFLEIRVPTLCGIPSGTCCYGNGRRNSTPKVIFLTKLDPFFQKLAASNTYSLRNFERCMHAKSWLYGNRGIMYIRNSFGNFSICLIYREIHSSSRTFYKAAFVFANFVPDQSRQMTHLGLIPHTFRQRCGSIMHSDIVCRV
jgi:hypothetical protein